MVATSLVLWLTVRQQSARVTSKSTARIGAVIYTIENIVEAHDDGAVRRYPRLLRDGKKVRDLIPDSAYLEGRSLRWPFAGKLIGVRLWAASCYYTWFYRLDSKGLHGPMAELKSGMNGGPVYRDVDRDGRPEMVFDNYSYYLDHPRGSLPNRYLVYKVDRRGRMRFWKSLPNPKHEALKDTVDL